MGKPFSGYGTFTGQGNGQGGREHGQKADQLPGYRRVDDPIAREHVAAIWGVAPSAIPGPGQPAVALIDSIGTDGGLRGLLVVGSNILVSAPNSVQVERRLKALDFLVVADFFLSETASLADVVLPSAQWAEEDGTMTNLEGRVILRRRAVDPPAGVRTDIDILCGARGASRPTAPVRVSRSSRRVRRAAPGDQRRHRGLLRHHVRAHRGAGRRLLAVSEHGSSRHAASVRRRLSRRRAAARDSTRVPHQSPADDPDAEFPLHLTTGRLLAHYQSGTQTRRVDGTRRKPHRNRSRRCTRRPRGCTDCRMAHA